MNPQTSWIENPFRYVDVAGNQIRYIREGKGEPVVLVHGSCASIYTWRYTISQLAKSHDVIALDLPGFGFSDKPKVNYTPRFFADSLQVFIDRLNLGAVHLVGSSLGATISGMVALDSPKTVKTLTLIDPRVYVSKPVKVLNRMLAAPFLGRIILKSFNSRIVTAMELKDYYFDKNFVDHSLIDHYFEPLVSPGANWSVHSVMQNCDYTQVFDARASELQQPVLILWGEFDHLFPTSDGKRLASEIPNSRLTIIEKAGHLPHEEQADIVNELLLDFFS